MKFLILSDVHAISEELSKLPDGHGYHGEDGSGFRIENRTKFGNRILALGDCLKDQTGQIDVLVCLGDFAHQAKKLVLLQVWHDLHEVAQRLNIPMVIGITGNHDIATRIEDIDEAASRVEFLKQIRPEFPSPNSLLNDGYHNDGVGTCEVDQCLLVALDTCQLHGLGKNGEVSQNIWSIGHLTDGMIDKAMDAIAKTACEHVLVMMHHHPLKIDEIMDNQYDQMSNGPRFLELLGSSGKNCIVVHGHKHLVNLKRAPVGVRPAVLLSAASLAAYPYRGQDSHFSNQFHLLDFDLAERTRPQGTIFSWDWGASRWEASKKHTMPHINKFGPTLDIDAIEKKLRHVPIVSSLNRAKLLAAVPEVEYLSLDQVDEINNRLEPTGREIIQTRSQVSGMMLQGDEL